MSLNLEFDALEHVSPWVEMGAYEALWCRRGVNFKKLAEEYFADPRNLPSHFVEPRESEKYRDEVFEIMGDHRFGLRLRGTGDYPAGLLDAKYPAELIYYQGNWDLIHGRKVSIVGTRKPSQEGIQRTKKLVRALVEDGFTVVSGLALGIDTIAHTETLEQGGRTIGVIGTPLSETYPKPNAGLQDEIRTSQLLISPVPFIRYSKQHPKQNRLFFPERNIIMSALTEATIIVEASDTSGTMHQAKAAIYQNRKLFILESCFHNPDITWPARFEAEGAIRVKDYEDIRDHLCQNQYDSDKLLR